MKSGDLRQRLGITQRMIQWWVDHRVIRPHSRSGQYVFDEDQAMIAAIVAELRLKKRFSLTKIRRLKIKPTAAEALADFLVTDSRNAIYCSEAELLPTLAAARRGCSVVSLRELRARLNGQPAKKRRAAA